MAFDWSPYAVGGATRPDSFTGMDPEFSAALGAMFLAAPEEVRNSLRVNSGFRSNDTQQRLWDNALKKYGSPEAARKWVAPPGKSQHNHGKAADLQYASDAAKKWVQANAAQYGLNLPLGNEDWHIELANARAPQTAAAALNAYAKPVAAPTGIGFAPSKPSIGFGPSATPQLTGAGVNAPLAPQGIGGLLGPLQSVARTMTQRTPVPVQATIHNSGGSQPVTIFDGGNRPFDQEYHAGQNMAVYRANKAAMGDIPMTRTGAQQALSQGISLLS